MSRALPKELRTQKTNSLPKDLKAIAEELIGEKFGFEEEVVTRRDDPFPDFDGRFDRVTVDPRDVFIDPEVRDRGHRRGDVSDIRVTNTPWSMRSRLAEIEITYPSWDNLLVARRNLEMQNIRMNDRPRFIMHPEFYHFFMRTEDARINFRHSNRRVREGERAVVGEIMGCEVIVTPQVRHCILQVEF